jgi:glycosyltransferase involved in cell wall biosynthesis
VIVLKVTFVCLEWPSESHVGGVGRYAHRIATALNPLVDLTVVTFEGGTEIPGVRMVYVRKSRSRIDRFYVVPLLLRKTVRSIESDVVHAFGDDWALTGTAPIVRTFLGASINEARSSTGLRKLNHYVLAATESWSRSRAAYKIAIGPDSNLAFDCATVMPPVVPVVRPRSVEKSATPSVVFIGSFAGRKRGQMVEKAVAEVADALERDVSLTVIGPASDAPSWSDLTRHISGADDEEVASVVAQSWVLMAPSLYEGFGIPVFEGLSLGTAVIASRNPGTEYIGSFGPSASSLALADDDDLVTALASRIGDGPHLQPAELKQTEDAVQAILRAADPHRLVSDIYEAVSRPR